MKHLNGHIICAIDCETTGLEPFYNDLIQVAVLPLDFDLRPDGDILPFECVVKPRRPENINPEAIKSQRNRLNDVIVNGLDPDFAADLFTEWFEQLPCPVGKRILPLAHNWAFDCTFIEDWLGHEHFQYIFDGRFRDTMVIANYLNDVADAQVENYPFPKHNLQYLVRCLGIDFDPTRGHDAVYDAAKTAEVYRVLVRHNMIDLRSPLL